MGHMAGWGDTRRKGTPADTNNSSFFPSEYPVAMTVHFELDVFAGGLGSACTGYQHLSLHSAGHEPRVGLQDLQRTTV
jgi:hypothetical protein